MKKMLDELKKNIDIYKVILCMIIFVLIIVIVVMYQSNNQTKNTNPTDNIKIQEMLDNKETALIFVYSSKNDKCPYCAKVSNYLENNNINYLSYDIEKVTKENYQELLSALNIDSKIFGYPSLIYIKEGSMFANIINIDNTEVVETFISDYDLNLQ